MSSRAFAAATALSVAALWSASGGEAAPITHGYPYAARCPASGIADDVDRWAMDMCNCTSYVAWALQANGQRTDWFVAGAMDARNWPHVAELAGFRVDSTPAVGAVVVWPKLARPFGHVAYVTGIERGGDIDVSEYNAPGMFRFGYDTRTGVAPAGALFIHVPKVFGSSTRSVST